MMFPVTESSPFSYMKIESDTVIRFTQDKIAEIKALILAMDNTITEQVLDATAQALINAGSLSMGQILANAGVTTRDYAYMVANNYIVEE